MVSNPRCMRSLAVLLLAGVSLAACATPHPRLSDRLAPSPGGRAPSGAGAVYKVGEPYQVGGIWYVPREQPDYDVTGVASWYGDAFNQKPTANGEIFDMGAISGAHTTLPLPSMVEVTNLDNGRKLMVRVNDRGPFVGGRVIDLSHAAARELGYDQRGLARVRVRYVGPAALPDSSLRYAANAKPSPSPRVTPASSYAPPVPPIAAPGYTPPIVTAQLPPPPVSVLSSVLAPVSSPVAAPVVAPAPAAPATIYRIQAGAFSDQMNAQHVATQLASAGQVLVEPVQHNGGTLYRVMVQGPTDEGEAWALRDQVAQLGFADARVIRPQ